MTDTPMTRIRALLALAAALAFALSFAGCKNFMKSDDDVKETMEQEVTIANAPVVSVRVQSSDTNLGSVTPNGPTNFKLNVSQTVTANEVNGGFIKWAAYYDNDFTTPVTDAVTFSAVKDGDMKSVYATVLQNRPGIVIQAMFEKRPAVTYYFPNSALYGDSYTNSPIRITFSKPIDPASLTTVVDGKSVSNISIVEYFAGVTSEISSTKYGAPSLSIDGKVITLKNVTPMSAKNTVTVKVAKAVTDISGLKMADDYSFSFMVGASADKDPPVIGAIGGGLTESYEFPASEAARRVTGGTVYLVIMGDDIGAGVEGVKIETYLTKYDDLGASPVKVDYAAKTFPWTDNAGTKTSFTDAELSASGIKEDGLVTFAIKLWDGNQNEAQDAVLYRFVRDTTPPSILPAQLARVKMSGVAGGGYYNRNSIVVFSQNSADPILDAGYGGGGGVPSLRSATVYYRFALNASAFPDATTGWTPTTSGVAIPASGLSEGSAVPVLVQFKDDLGNVSAAVNLTSIKIDNTPPTGSVTFDFPQLNGIWQRNALDNVPFTVTGNPDTSGVAKFYVSDANVAPTDASAWQDFPAGASGASGTVSFSNASDGTKILYAWFMDAAGNISTAPATCQLVKDGTDPTVSKFFLRKTQLVTGTDDLAVPGGTQYSNDTQFYFAFVTQDVGAGPAKFRFSDGAYTSDTFNIATNSAPQGSNKLTVSNLMVSNTASGTLVLGILTVSDDAQGAKSVTLWVTDAVGNEMDTGVVNANGAGNCVYDSIPPSTDPLTALTATDASNGALHNGGGRYFSKDPSVKVTIQASDGTGSGLDYAAFSSVSGGATVASPTVTFGAGTTATTAVTLANEGTVNVVSATPRDKAANAGTTRQVELMLDRTPPELELYLYSPDTLDANCTTPNQKIIKARTSTEEVLYSWASHDWTTFKVGMIGIDNANGSGIRMAASHQYRLIKRTFPGGIQTDETTAVSGNLNPTAPSTITIPPAELVGDKSAIWLLSAKAIDNVGNERASFESVGFAYDKKTPSIDNASVKVTVPGNIDGPSVAKTINHGTAVGVWPAGDYYYVPASALAGDPSQTLCVQLMATDRPGDDPGGSGLSAVNPGVSYVDVDQNVVTTPAATYSTIGETTWIKLPAAGGGNWPFNKKVFMSFTPVFVDKCANTATGSTIIVAIDDLAPTASPTFSNPPKSGKIAGAQYIPSTATLSFATTDPQTSAYVTQRRPSGFDAYALTSSGTAPLTGDSEWKTSANGAAVTIPAATLQTKIGAGTTPLYLHLRDKVGNLGIVDVGQTRIDSTDPTISNLRVTYGANVPATFVNGAFYVNSPTFTVYATPADEADGSGIAGYSMSAAYQALGATAWNDDISTSVIYRPLETEVAIGYSDFNLLMKKAMRVRIVAYDKVENSGASATSAAEASNLEIRYDSTAPSPSATLGSGTYYDDGTDIFISTGTTMSLAIEDTTVDGRVPSGIKSFMVRKLSAGIPNAASADWIAYTGNAATDNAAAMGRLLAVTQTLSTAEAMYLFALDNVGNVSAGVPVVLDRGFLYDITPPTVSVTTKVPCALGWDGSTYFVNKSPIVSFDTADGGSGPFKYLYTANASETATTVNTGTVYTATVTNDPVSAFNATTAQQLYVHVSDRAGNVSSESIVDHAAKLDNTLPSVTAVAAWDTSPKNKQKKADDDGVTAVKITYPANAERDSGLKAIRFSGPSLASPTGLSVKMNGTDTVALASTNGVSYTTGSVTVTFANPVELSSAGFFYVYNLKLIGTDPSYSVTFIDATGNESATSPSDTIKIDGIAPAITFDMKDDDQTITTHSSRYPAASGTVTEEDSGIAEIAITGIGGLTAPSVTIGSTTYSVGNGKLSVSESSGTYTLTLTPAHVTSGDEIFTISAIDLGVTDGDKNVGVTFTDAADRTDTESYSITLDTGVPTVSLQPSSGGVYPTSATGAGQTKEYFVTGSTSVNFNWAGTDPAGSGILGYVRNGTPTEKTSGMDTINVSAGATASVVSRDKVGNVSGAAAVTVTVDNDRPTFTMALKSGSVAVSDVPLEITTGAVTAHCYAKTYPVYTVTVSDAKSGPQGYTFNSAQHTGATGEVTLGWGVGQTIYATDNLSNASYTLTLTVHEDNAGPDVHITPTGTDRFPTTADQAIYYTTGDELTFTIAVEDFATFTKPTVSPARPVSGTAAGTSASFTVAIPSDGTEYSITCEDGLANPTVIKVTVFKDDDDPTMTLVSPASVLPASDTLNAGGSKTYYTATTGSLTFTLAANDATLKSYMLGATETDVSGTTITNISLGLTSSTLPGTTNTIVVKDKLGNSSTCSVKLVYDDSKPGTFTVTPAGSNFSPSTGCGDGATTTYFTKNNSLDVTISAADTGSGILKCYAHDTGAANNSTDVTDVESPYSLSLAEGKTWAVHAVNLAGVETTATIIVKKDTDNPTLTLKTPTDSSVSPSNVTIASGNTVYVNGTSVEFTATTGDGSGSGVKNITVSGSGSETAGIVTLPVSATAYTVTVYDNVGNSTPVTVTVTKDTEKPSITFNGDCVSDDSGKRKVVVTLSDSLSRAYSLASTSGSASYTVGNATGTVSGITGDTEIKITATDKVGNESSKWCYIEANWPSVNNFVDVPEMWTISPSGSDYTINVSDAKCKTWVITDTATTPTTKASGSGSPISATLPIGSYYLKLTDWQPHTMSIFFKVGAGTVSSASVLGNTVIGARLSPETITATARKEHFDRARSSSDTNLPVWFTDVGKNASSSPTRASDRDRASRSASAEAPSKASATRNSAETLQSAARTSFAGTSKRESFSEPASRVTKPADTQSTGDGSFVAVMTAREGSPAFVAYARGIAALRGGNGSDNALSGVTRAGIAVEDDAGEKPEGIWEKLLAFFGVDRSRHGRRESEGNGFFSE